MTDPIADMLNRIRNAQAVSHQTVSIPFSKLKFEISKILEKENFINKTEKKGKKEKKTIEINLKYESRQERDERGQWAESGAVKKGVIDELKRISKPGQRIYGNAEEARKLKRGYGILIISTSKGVMTDRDARKQGVGGEILFEVW